MIASDMYQNCYDCRSQCHCADIILKSHGWTNSKIAKLFGVDHKAYEKQIKLPLDSNNNGRPSLLDEDEENTHPTLYDIEQMVIEDLIKYYKDAIF